jgi:hypothetical protein
MLRKSIGGSAGLDKLNLCVYSVALILSGAPFFPLILMISIFGAMEADYFAYRRVSTM